MDDEKSSYNQSEILSRVNTWISNCDAKISFALAFAGALLGVFFTSKLIQNSLMKIVKNVSDLEVREVVSIVSILILVGFITSLTLSVWYLFKGLKGAIDSSNYVQEGIEKESLLFFGTISSMNYKEFKEKVNDVKRNELENDYLSQIHINSTICNNKFINYNKGIKFLVSSIVFFILLNLSFLFLQG